MKKSIKFLLIFNISLLFFSCQEDEKPLFDIAGELLNNTTRAVRNANVSINLKGQTDIKGSATTNDEGKYQLDNLEPGLYEIKFTASGYNTLTKEIEVKDQNISDFKNTILGSANVSGTIINSQTGLGFANASVSFSLGSDTSAAKADLEAKTNSSGSFTINNAPIGTFVRVIRAVGFTPRVTSNINLATGTNSQGSTVLVQGVAAGQLRIILTWGASPSDLDSHLTGPNSTGSGRFHMYFSNRNPNADINLDVDDLFSFGPETTTIKKFYTGMYRYSVHNYSNQGSSGSSGIFQSPAKVEVYNSTGLIHTFTAPTSTTGNTWRVFEVNATTSGIEIIPINTYVTVSSSSDTTIFKQGNQGKKNVLFSLADF